MALGHGAALGALLIGACSFAPSGLDVPSLGDDDDVPIDAPTIDAPPGIDAITPCADADADGVCDTADRCPGHDDNHNADGDTMPDDCDDWDCGPDRPTVTLPVTIGDDLTIEQVSINGGGAIEELGRNLTRGLVVRYEYTDDDPGEPDQLEFGVADGNRLACRRTSDEILGWTAPPIGFTTGNTYRTFLLTAQPTHESNCTSGQRDRGWANDAPAGPIIGAICVR